MLDFFFFFPSVAVFLSFVANIKVYLWAEESYTLCDNVLWGFI